MYFYIFSSVYEGTGLLKECTDCTGQGSTGIGLICELGALVGEGARGERVYCARKKGV